MVAEHFDLQVDGNKMFDLVIWNRIIPVPCC